MRVFIALVIAIILIILLNDGCCGTNVLQKPEVRIDTLRIVNPATFDTLTIIKRDTIWSASNGNYSIRIDTLIKRIYVNRYADTLKVPYLDTVIIYQTVKSKDFLDGFTLKDLLIIGFFVLIGSVVYSIVRR